MSLEELNDLPERHAKEAFHNCCAAGTWVRGMVDGRPYSNPTAMLNQSHALWPSLTEEDWLQAFEAHPRIGDIDSLRQKYASTRSLASGEQAGARQAPEELLQRLKVQNDAYLEKFGFIFIVCATGKSAEEMLTLLETRLANSRKMELGNAAREQAKIAELRLEKLV